MSSHRSASARRKTVWAAAALAAVLLLGLLGDSYVLYRIHIQRLGNALDYYPFWAGGREVILSRQNPYDPSVMLEIQQSIYGRPALPGENQHGYAYPAYAAFVVFPFLLLSFPASASLWIASQQILVVIAVALAAAALGWKIGRWHLLLLCLVAMTFRYSMITFVLGQTASWVLFSLALALWAAQRGRGVLVGLALAAGSIKPQLAILPALAMLVTMDPRQRSRALWTLAGAMGALLVCSLLFAGPWIGAYWKQLQAYQGYSTTGFPMAALAWTWLPRSTSQLLNASLSAVLLGFLAIALWNWRGTGRSTLPVGLAVVVTQLVVPQTGSYNLVVLLLPAIVALHGLRPAHRRRNRFSVAGRVLVWADLLIVPWILWATARAVGGVPWDTFVVPAFLLIAVLCALASFGRKASARDQGMLLTDEGDL